MDDLLADIAADRDALKALDDEATLIRARRDRRIRKALQAGYRPKKVREAAGVGQSRIDQIAAAGTDDPQDE